MFRLSTGNGRTMESDEWSPEERLVWAIIADAVCCSIMTRDLDRWEPTCSRASASSFIEAREWLLRSGMEQGGFTRDMCLDILDIRPLALANTLKEAWSEFDKTIEEQLTEKLHMARIKRDKEREGKKNIPKGRRGPKKSIAEKEFRIFARASAVRRLTNEMLGV